MLSREVPGSSPGIFKILFRPRLDKLKNYQDSIKINQIRPRLEPVIEKVGVTVCQDFLEKSVKNATKDMKIFLNVPLLVKK